MIQSSIFKIIVLQKYYGQSEETELQTLDRFNFQHFLELYAPSVVPDKNTVRLLKDLLGKRLLPMKHDTLKGSSGYKSNE